MHSNNNNNARYQQRQQQQQKKIRSTIQELDCSLSEWGVGLTAQRDTKANHCLVRKKVVDAGVAMLSETLREPYSVQDLRSQQFPTTIDDAYRYVLSHEDVPLPIFRCIDNLEAAGMPFHRCHDRREPSSKSTQNHREVTWYQRKIEFKGLALEKLDPFHRFKYVSITCEEEIYRRWFVEDDASKNGLLMEAAVACHAIHKETCVNCKAIGALRWKGGSGASWQDLVCTNCMAMYEVKTKESMEQIQGVVDRSHIRGGSFRVACRLQNSLLPGQKRYIVFLPRNATSKRMKMVHPVQVVEIGFIVPAVSRMVFCDRRRNVEIQSRVILRSRTRQHWFDLPLVQTQRPLETIAKDVFLEKFSKNQFNGLKIKYSEELIEELDDPPPSTQGSAIQTPKSKKSNNYKRKKKLKKIKAELAQNATPDDWEDLLSDSSDKDDPPSNSS